MVFARNSIERLLVLLLALAPLSVARAAQEQAPAAERPSVDSIDEELKSFTRSTVSVREAAKMAERTLAGAKVVDLSFDGQGGAPTFRIKACRADKIWEVLIDAATRRIVRAGALMSVSELDPEDRSRIADLMRSAIDLSDATVVAEKYASGKAISAGLSHADGRLIFLVVVVSGGELREISVDPPKETQGRGRSSKAATQKLACTIDSEGRSREGTVLTPQRPTVVSGD